MALPISNTPIVLYDYVGLNMFAIVDLGTIDVQLDRSASSDGARLYSPYTGNPGKYPGFDRFGRVVKHMWVDGSFTTGTGDNPNVPPIVAYDYGYDESSNRTFRYNENPVLSEWKVRDEDFDYDGLDRLTKAWRGKPLRLSDVRMHESPSGVWA